jgi:hypothetical protein
MHVLIGQAHAWLNANRPDRHAILKQLRTCLIAVRMHGPTVRRADVGARS